MLTPSKKLFYAVEAVLFIAFNSKAGPISGRDLAEKQGLPPRYLEPMLQKLVHAGILRGVRGPQGGYELGRERRRITLADICATLAEEKEWPEHATPLGERVLRNEAHALSAAWNQSLSNIDMASLCERAAALKIAPAYATAHDFAI